MMWKCSRCTEPISNHFSRCWNCGTTQDGVEDAEFDSRRQEAIAFDPSEAQASDYVQTFHLKTLFGFVTFFAIMFALLKALPAIRDLSDRNELGYLLVAIALFLAYGI